MSTQVLFKDFERTENLETYLTGQVEDLLNVFLPQDSRYNLRVKVGEIAHRHQQRKPKFECTINLKLDKDRKVFKVSKQSPLFYESVQSAVMALRKILSKKHSLKKNHHRPLRLNGVA